MLFVGFEIKLTSCDGNLTASITVHYLLCETTLKASIDQ